MNKITETKWFAWGGGVVFLVLLFGLFYPQVSSRLYLRKAMHILDGASSYASRSYQGSGTGGFVYQLNGPVSETDFLNCVKTLGLTQYDPEQHGALSTPRLASPDSDRFWSNEPSSLDHYFFRKSLSERFVVRAKWDNGQIYFLATRPGAGFGHR